MFKVGQKIVCIDDRRMPHKGYGDEVLPKYGQVYTVRDTEMRPIVGAPEGDYFGQGVWLNEIVNPIRPYATDGVEEMWEVSFRSGRFRPVVERKTDVGIAILKKLLQLKPERVE